MAFPPRNEPYDFRLQLERKYREGLQRAPGQVFVDPEGSIVWTQEYLRYRVNACTHAEATQRVLFQVGGGGVLPVCGESAAGQVLFPPREESFDFRLQLERRYRETLQRAPSESAVDAEGDIVWTQEYLRYRVNGCTHPDGVDRVFMQIDGRGVQPVCRAPEPPPPSDVPFQYVVSPEDRTVGTTGGLFTVDVRTNRQDARWTATSDQPWLFIVSGRSGTGNGAVTYSVGSNSLGSERRARLTVSGLSGLYPPGVHTVTQRSQ